MRKDTLKKNRKNSVLASKLNIGDRVEVIKTGETGVIIRKTPYPRTNGLDYTSISVRMDNADELPHHQKSKGFSASSLKKLRGTNN